MFRLEVAISEEGTTEVVSSVFACLVSTTLFVSSPLPTIWRRFKKTDIDDCHFYPHSACYLYNAVWIMYVSSLRRYEYHYMCQLYTGCIGFLVAAAYNLILIKISPILNKHLGLTAFFCVSLYYILWLIIYCVSEFISTFLLGLLVMVCGITMYASPLFIIENCRKANVVAYLPSWLCFAYLLNGAAWVIIAFLISTPDLIVTVTNGIGALLGLVQLGIIYKFRLIFSSSSEAVDHRQDRKFVSFLKYFGNVYVLSALVVIVAVLGGYFLEPFGVSKSASPHISSN